MRDGQLDPGSAPAPATLPDRGGCDRSDQQMEPDEDAGHREPSRGWKKTRLNLRFPRHREVHRA
jgi:hypothetical protein